MTSKLSDEAGRLTALDRYNILNTPNEASYDEITRLIARICETPIAIITFAAEDRLWIKSQVGLDPRFELPPLEQSICAHAIRHSEPLFVIPDLREDARFAGNSKFIEAGLRFFAGAALQSSEGHALGTLAVLDHEPRQLTGLQRDTLCTMARQVMAQLEARRAVAEAEIAKRRRVEEALRASEDRFRRLVEISSTGVVLLRASGQIDFANKTFLDMTGYTEADLREGRMHRDRLTPKGYQTPAWVRAELAAHGVVRPFERDIVAKDGRVIPTLLGIAVLEGTVERGDALGAVFVNDLTSLKRTEAALRESEDRLRLAVEATRLGIWDRDLVTGRLIATDYALALLGFGRDDRPTYAEIIDRVHPEDRPLAESLMARAFDPKGDGSVRVEGRIRIDGVSRWVSMWGRVFFDERDGESQATRLLSTLQDVTERKQAETALREETRTLDILHRTGTALTAQLDLDPLIRMVTDAGTELSGAEFGTFFYKGQDERDPDYAPYALSGASEVFAAFPKPLYTAVFGPTLRGEAVVRSDDMTRDPRFARSLSRYGMPEGHPPVRSCLSSPVISRSGEVLGGLLFGHSKPGVFTERIERIITGIAAQAAIAIDNARLYQSAQREIDQRRRAEKHQKLLIQELNHRVKNTLATVQSIARQTLRSSPSPETFREAFSSRLLALSQTHSLLSQSNWEGASLCDVLRAELSPYRDGGAARVSLDGEDVDLAPRVALSLGMAFHELLTNALKHGALCSPTGHVHVSWTVRAADAPKTLHLEWSERGGPRVEKPQRRGFGLTLIERGLAHELRGRLGLDFVPEGVHCTMQIPLPMED